MKFAYTQATRENSGMAFCKLDSALHCLCNQNNFDNQKGIATAKSSPILGQEIFPFMNNKPILTELHTLERNDGGKSVHIMERIGPQHNELAAYLLDDDYGDKLDIIKANANGLIMEINRNIFKSWLDGKGKNVSWKTLLYTVREKSQLNSLADDIESALQTMTK